MGLREEELINNKPRESRIIYVGTCCRVNRVGILLIMKNVHGGMTVISYHRGDARMARHALWRDLEVRIGPVQEGLASLRQILQKKDGRWRCRTFRTAGAAAPAAAAASIFNIKTETEKSELRPYQTSDRSPPHPTYRRTDPILRWADAISMFTLEGKIKLKISLLCTGNGR
ncbi:unnamed protein product, partial [Nesidiocoris tenuis]